MATEFLMMGHPRLDTLTSLRDLDDIALSRKGIHRDVVFGFAATFAFEGGATVRRRLDSLAMMEAFVRPFGDRFNHYHPAKARSCRRGTVEKALAHYREQAEVTRAEQSGGAVLQYLAKPTDSASATQFVCYAGWASKWDRWSTVVAAQPVGTVLDRGHAGYISDVLAWCDVLQPGHGTAGLAVIPDFGSGTRAGALLAWPGLMRHPGFDWPYISLWAAMARADEGRHLRTVNWLTILDDAFVERLGGRMALAEAAGADVTVHDWQGGVLLQAGAAPVLGDLHVGDIPAAYRAVSAATQALRFMDFEPRYGFLDAPAPILPGEASVQWLERFDTRQTRASTDTLSADRSLT